MIETNFLPRYAHSRAIVIGIDSYAHAAPLTYAVSDCDAVAEILQDKVGFPSDDMTILRNDDATREGIMSAYLSLAEQADSENDRVVFFFAGHGLTRQGYRSPVGYLVPADGDPDRIGTLIRWDAITGNAELIRAKHILFVFDACFSGLALRRAATHTSERFLSELLQRRSRQVIAAGKADQTVADGGGPTGSNSVFTGHLLEGLEGGASLRDGLITANSLMHYVYQHVGNDTASRQTPHYGYIDGDGDLILVAPGHDIFSDIQQDALVEPPKPGPLPELLYQEEPHRVHAFSTSNGYDEPASPNFGRNDYSRRLATLDFDGDRQETMVQSWLALVLEPATPLNAPLNLSEIANAYKGRQPSGDQPQLRLRLPDTLTTSLNAVCLCHPIQYQSPHWSWFIRIHKSGAIELADGYHTFFTYKEMRAFRYVQIVGLAWQFLFFGKQFFVENGCEMGARLLVNLIGTRDTILADFAKGKGKDNRYWVQPGERPYLGGGQELLGLKCPDPNLQLEYTLVPSTLNDATAFTIVRSFAESLGLAYNHQTEPRCFVYGTEDFPWRQYFDIR